MERQFLVAQLAILLEQGTTQDRLGRQALPSGGLDGAAAQIARDQAKQNRCLSSHCDIVFSSRPISCPVKRSNRLAWTCAMSTHCRLRRVAQTLGISGMIPTLPETATARGRGELLKAARLPVRVAEGAGFEPARDFRPCPFSRREPSAARPPLQCLHCAFATRSTVTDRLVFNALAAYPLRFSRPLP